METKLILLTGRAGAGKSTVADMLEAAMPGPTIQIAQSEPLKQLARDVFQFDDRTLNGPSSERNKKDPRWESPSYWSDCLYRLQHVYGVDWLNALGGFGVDDEWIARLVGWFMNERGMAHTARGFTARRILQTLGTEFGRKTFGADVWVDYALRRADAFEALGNRVIITDGRFANEAAAVKAQGGTVIHVKGPDHGKPALHASEAEVDGIPFDFQVLNHYRTDDEGGSWSFLRTQINELKGKL